MELICAKIYLNSKKGLFGHNVLKKQFNMMTKFIGKKHQSI